VNGYVVSAPDRSAKYRDLGTFETHAESLAHRPLRILPCLAPQQHPFPAGAFSFARSRYTLQLTSLPAVSLTKQLPSLEAYMQHDRDEPAAVPRIC
jgi:hypothetical protein